MAVRTGAVQRSGGEPAALMDPPAQWACNRRVGKVWLPKGITHDVEHFQLPKCL